MSIKGTLESFNLCELLQMLALNQKEGTLVLEAEGGARTLYLDAGKLTFLQTDAGITTSVLRLARRDELASEPRLKAALERHRESGHSLLEAFESQGLAQGERLQDLFREAALEQLFEAQLTAVAGFEFVEGRALQPDGSEGHPIQPSLAVEGLLLDLARMLDHWNEACAVVPGPGEIYEGTGIAVDLSEVEDVDGEMADRIVPLIDGRRSLDQIAEAAHATVFAATQVAAALFEGGGLRAVPTDDLMHRAEDLLACGEAAAALPLLRRAIERGDAPLEVRVRLADALEASGQPAEAAAELDTYAALADTDLNAPAVFEALTRALGLRDGDFATAARACDYYLRRRPWLQEYRMVATHALRDLIHGATAADRPIDAALRLKGFIDAGDAPGEDLPLLADLFEAAGERKDAAQALFRRAQDLMVTDRPTPARQLLRRALELDPGNADARRLQMDLEGTRRRRGHRARIALILLALCAVASAAGVAWYAYRDTASTEIQDTQTRASHAIAAAEERGTAAIEVFRKRATAAASGAKRDDGLAQAADAMRTQVKRILDSTHGVLDQYAAALDSGQATGHTRAHREMLERFEQRSLLLTKNAEAAVQEQAEKAHTILGEALQQDQKGQFVEARRLLTAAWNLAFADAATRVRAERTLRLVNEYFDGYQKVHDDMVAKTKAGQLRAAFAAGLAGLGQLLDSDLTRKLPFPLRVTTDPPGAHVWLGDEDTGQRTPCVFTYSPFVKDLALRLRMPGRKPSVTELPGFGQMRRDPASLADFEPAVHAKLPPGERWRAGTDGNPLGALWIGSGMPLVAGNGGHLIYAVSPRDGRMVPGVRMDPGKDGIRMAGRHETGLEWHITGHRTLSVHDARGAAWEQVAVGRLEHAPIVADGKVVVVDQVGAVYAWDVRTGEARWRTELGAPPTQQPYFSALGILMAVSNGAVYRIDPESGHAKPLAPSVAGAGFALPYGDGAVVLGGGSGGCRSVGPDGRVVALGDALPDVTRVPWIGPKGVAWIEDDGVRWLGAGAPGPTRVSGLGKAVEHLGGGGGELFGACRDGVLRCASLTRPETALWSAPLGGRAQTPPLRLGDAVYLLVDGHLVAFDV